MNARTTALSALIAVRRQNAWADGALKEYIARDRLSRRDAALAARLVYGVVQNRLLPCASPAARQTGRSRRSNTAIRCSASSSTPKPTPPATPSSK